MGVGRFPVNKYIDTPLIIATILVKSGASFGIESKESCTPFKTFWMVTQINPISTQCF